MSDYNQNQPDLSDIFKMYQAQYPEIKDFSGLAVPVIVKLFGQQIKTAQLNDTPNDYTRMETFRKSCFYGGITNNIPENLARHHIDKYLFCAFVDSYDIARKVEEAMCRDLDIYIGKDGEESAGNGGKNEDKPDDSRVVYLADRTLPNFQE